MTPDDIAQFHSQLSTISFQIVIVAILLGGILGILIGWRMTR